MQICLWICIADAKSCYVTVSKSILAIKPTYCPPHVYIRAYSLCTMNPYTRNELVGTHRCFQPQDIFLTTCVATMSLLFLWRTRWRRYCIIAHNCTLTRSKRSVECVHRKHTHAQAAYITSVTASDDLGEGTAEVHTRNFILLDSLISFGIYDDGQNWFPDAQLKCLLYLVLRKRCNRKVFLFGWPYCFVIKYLKL